MPISKNDVDALELFGEQEARLAETLRRKQLELTMDKIELKLARMKKSYTLTSIAFHSGVPMDSVRDMVVTKSGVFVKGVCNVGPIPINSGSSEEASRERTKKASSRRGKKLLQPLRSETEVPLSFWEEDRSARSEEYRERSQETTTQNRS